MNKILRLVKSLFLHTSESSTPSDVDRLLMERFNKVREVNPDTQQQWMRLQRAIAESEPSPAREYQHRVPRLALVFALIVTVAGSAYLYFTLTQPEIITTARGEQKEVQLEDGSSVTLSYATALVVPKRGADDTRRVELKGEAYFRVRKSDMPFIVSTAIAEVRVVGTEFNLRARGGALEVAVVEGLVEVIATRNGKTKSLVLAANQMTFVPENGFPESFLVIPSAEYPGWLHGKLFLNRTTLREACQEIEMRFDVNISIPNHRKASEAITGVLEAKTAEAALAALCEVTGSRFRHHDGRYEIYE
ncbi:MAG TPA: FecR domain-containing protein [Bacteroidota bacterium]|nr:FecR domain-containing protein [Bacteroidota bacterium]